MSAAEAITRAYNGEWHGDYGAIPTPGHSKRDRGTTVRDGEDGDVLFNSFNGGDWRALKDECRERGFLPERGRLNGGGGASGAAWRDVAAFEYADADGTVLYRTVRREKQGERKKFVAQRPDGRGGWINGMGDVERVPYRLPDIRAAVASMSDGDAPPLVYLTEGERKADKLASWGFVATAVAFGAKGWRDSYAQALSGCTVVILPDNDDEGRGFADTAAASIRAAGGAAHILSLPDLPPKGDVIDWKGTADDLRALTDAAISGPAEAPETFPVADLTAWAKQAPVAKAFVMAGTIPEGEVTLFTGGGGTNKSTFGLQLCACAAAALPMLGIAVTPGHALYVTAEDEDRENHWRLSKIAGALGTTFDRLAGRLHVASLRGRLNNELATYDQEGRIKTAPAYNLLRATIVSTGARLVVLDNLGHLYVGNENDRGQVTAFINLLYALCRELGVTIVLIAHPNKAGDSYSGSTAWLNAVRSQIVLQRPEDGLDPDARVLTVGKANYARPDQQLAFRWHNFALVRDEDLPQQQRDEMAATIAATHDNEVFLACLAERNRQERPVSENKASRTYAPKEFTEMPEARGLSAARLEAAMERLYRSTRIGRGVVCRTGRKDREGLIKCADVRADPALTGRADVRAVDAPTCAHTHPYTTYREAGPLEGPPASHVEQASSDHPVASSDDDLTEWTD